MRALTSFTTRSAMSRSRSDSSSAARNFADSPMDRSHTSEMFLSPTVTASVAGFRRAPPQCGHGTSRMYVSICSRDQSLSDVWWRRWRNGMMPS